MKKAISIISSLGFLISASGAFAQGAQISIAPPVGAINATPTAVINSFLVIIFSVAALVVLFYLIIGAFEWITSGGEKEGLGKARNRITHALVGLLILALSFVIITLVGNLLGTNLLSLQLPQIGK